MGHILAALDFSELTDPVVDQARRFCNAFTSPVTLIHVAAPNPAFVGNEVDAQSVNGSRSELLRVEHSKLLKQAAKLQAEGIDTDTLLIEGDFVATILKEADRLKSDLIILGSQGHGVVYDVLIGSVCEGVIRQANCPVLLIPDSCSKKSVISSSSA